MGKGKATVVKVSKPNQDFRFDVPVIGPLTIETAGASGILVLAVEAGKTLLLDKAETARLCEKLGVTLIAVPPPPTPARPPGTPPAPGHSPQPPLPPKSSHGFPDDGRFPPRS
jgi:hypothetical protein